MIGFRKRCNDQPAAPAGADIQPQNAAAGNSRRRRIRRGLTAVALLVWLGPCVFARGPHTLPPGAGAAGPVRKARDADVRLLVDETAWDAAAGRRVIRQEIFDACLEAIRQARRLIVADFFLWNSWTGAVPERHRALADELAQALIARRRAPPEADIWVLTDPINGAYGDALPDRFRELQQAGIRVVVTPLVKLPDSNGVYSPYARAYGPALDALDFGFFDRPLVRHPFEANAPRISWRQFGRLLQFKANHRKVLVADAPEGGWRAIAGSANPADGSSAHSNLALDIRGASAADALASELSLLRWALGPAMPQDVPPLPPPPPPSPDSAPAIQSQWLAEGAIRARLLAWLADAGPGDDVRAAVFYLSDREVVRALRDASHRGARVRLILDANRDAFGHLKNGIPNRPIAASLLAATRRDVHPLEIRWASTHGEQFHPKALLVTDSTAPPRLLVSSANWTRRNLQNLNLEAGFGVEGPSAAARRFAETFDRWWANADGLEHTVPYSAFEEPAAARAWKTPLGWLQEVSGASTF